MIRRSIRGLYLIAVLLSCRKSVADPTCDRCDEMRIRSERTAYRPTAAITFTITNLTSGTLRYDWCSVVAGGRTNTSKPFNIEYRPDRRCGAGAGAAEVLANMRVLAAGASVRDSVVLSPGAYQGEYRVQIWLLDVAGLIEVGNPVVSNTFEVFPGAPQ